MNACNSTISSYEADERARDRRSIVRGEVPASADEKQNQTREVRKSRMRNVKIPETQLNKDEKLSSLNF